MKNLKELKKIFTKNHLIIDIQGVTAGNTIKEDIPYFTEQAPNLIIKHILYNKLPKQEVYIISQGDKSTGKIKLDLDTHQKTKQPHLTGIGGTISIVYQQLIKLGIVCKIFIIENKPEQIEELKNGELIPNNNDIIGVYNYNIDDKQLWLDDTSKYYQYTNIELWERYGRLDRLDNIIKQYLANNISNYTYILNHGRLEPTSLSFHYNEMKYKNDNIIIVN